MNVKESLFWRNFLAMVMILVISFVILAIAFSVLTYTIVNNEKQANLDQNAQKVSELLAAFGSEESLGSLPVRMAALIVSETTGYQIMVCDGYGQIVTCTGVDNEQMYLGKLVPQEMLSEIWTNGEYSGVTSLEGVFSSSRYVVGLPVNSITDGSVRGFVLVSGNLSTIDGIWRESAAVFAVCAFAVMVIAFILCMVLTRRLVEPINQMADAAHKFAKGDFSVRVPETGRQDEIGALAASFNGMADAMEKSENRRREFIANVSHELKTPMTTIAGFADGILDGTIPKSEQNEYLSIISSETMRLSRLVRSMLDMSKLKASETVEKKPFDLTEVVCQAILSLEKKITDRGLDVDAVLPEDPVKALGDQDSITQVVYNLIDNAAKFADKDSVIKIELWKQNGKAYVSVENRGETISQEELPLIFERFHKTDRSRSMDRDGVGLGLYIVKTIMDSHNGDIYVTSENNLTKFVISLELANS
ncbi:MAG: HAMP domain-containing histidine kinase [Oscillospiraceae bacterium]|nr:HAMP domain-containing histidine kinase [Oscillospiraceae bacterium]